MEELRVYRGLLKNRPLARLLAGEFISGIGDWLYIVAVFVVIYQESRDAALVGAFGAVRLLPYVVLSIPAGIIADRFDRRMVLIVSDLFRGGVMLAMAALVATGAPTVWIAGLAVLAACGSSFFYPAMGAYLPSLVADERQLGPANSAFASLGNLSFVVGPAIGGILLALGGVTLAFILNAATFAVIASILWTLPSSVGRAPEATAEPAPASEPAPPAEDAAEAPAGPAREPLAATPASAVAAASPLQRTPLAGLTVVQLVSGFLGGGIQVLTVVLAIDILKAGEAANGYLNTAIGVGGVIGGLVSGGLVLRRRLGVPLLLGALVLAAGMVALAVPDLAVALAAMTVASAGFLIVDVISTTIFQRLVPNHLMGRATGVLMSLGTISAAAGAFALPVLVADWGPLPALATSAVVSIVATGLGLLLIGAAATRPASPFEATLAEIVRLPLFAGVPAAGLEAAIHRFRPRDVRAGETIVRQGEPATAFYVIASGSFGVTQASGDGPPTELRTLGSNEVFGELGLLRQTPRTATVTAATDGVLLELDGADFLALAGSSGDLRGRLLGLYAGPGASSRS